MRIVFLGASAFGLRCLRAVHELRGCTLAGVVTAPRTFAISYRPQGVTNVLHADVTGWCEARGVAHVQIGPHAMRDPALLELVRVWRPDIFVAVGWYHMVPKSWRRLAPAYGLHGSLLPAYRGGAPLVWAIINGEQQAGITLFEFDDGVDTGPIVAQAPTLIGTEDTIATVYSRIEEIGEELLRESLPRLAEGTVVAKPQNLASGSVFPQRGPDDGLINWNWSAPRLYNFVRAQTRPYPGAFFLDRGTKVLVWSSRIATDAIELLPGEIQRVGDRVLVGAGGLTALELQQLRVDGCDIEATSRWP